MCSCYIFAIKRVCICINRDNQINDTIIKTNHYLSLLFKFSVINIVVKQDKQYGKLWEKTRKR